MNSRNEVKVLSGDSCEWRLNGKRHREGGPAVEGTDGHNEWYRNGKLHREDGPAIEWANGTRVWMTDGYYHREDGPAIERSDGTCWWYFRGRLIPVHSLEEFREATRLLMIEEVQES